MIGALYILLVTAAIGLVLWLLDRRRHKGETLEAPKEPSASQPADDTSSEEGECCGLHIVCEKDSLSPFTTEIEYYNDEELDRLRGIDPDEFTEEDVEELRDVLLTLRPEEIAGWSRSLQLRNIQLPQVLREELLMMVAEARGNK